MNIEKDYNQLYTHWLEEFEHVELTSLSNELLSYYNRILNQIRKLQTGQENPIKDKIVSSYRENIQYLIDDFLKLREIKIINAALVMKEIDFNKTLEAEKLFYQKLVGSLKGFKKMRSFSIDIDVSDDIQAKPEFTIQETIETEKSPPLKINDLTEQSELIVSKGKKSIDYTLIRFIEKAPPLVGMDFLSYGPFEKEDIAFLPSKNAKILITEKFAEIIEVSN